MIRVILAVSLIFVSTPSFAEEMWACGGFTHRDGWKDNHPFLIRGNKQRYTWMRKYYFEVILFVGESRIF